MSEPKKIALVTLFPEMFEAVTRYGVSGRAVDKGLVEVAFFNPRKFAKDRHGTIDDKPYGGGPGMVMMAEPLSRSIAEAKQWLQASTNAQVTVVYMSPQGRTLTQSDVAKFCDDRQFVIVSGRYEGIDERVIDALVDEEWSIGDYVLSGGELPAMVLMDAMTRLLPGVLGDAKSAEQDSFEHGLLDCPHYTRPEMFENRSVPAVLLSGNHADIDRWRHKQSLGRTLTRRPDLFEKLSLTDAQKALLIEYQKEREL